MANKNLADLFGDLRGLTEEEANIFGERTEQRFDEDIFMANYNIRYGHDGHSAHLISTDYTHGFVFVDDLSDAKHISLSLQALYCRKGAKIVREYVFHDLPEAGFMWETAEYHRDKSEMKQQIHSVAGALGV